MSCYSKSVSLGQTGLAFPPARASLPTLPPDNTINSLYEFAILTRSVLRAKPN
jgi:hypothetical protein